ncbi:uncharacterized protein LOC117108241 [Anneissia japonica]|uniref:uncharacterized protein LOC117108241 n=1 Tax=Anneissia japonica TaxID=1529436 RepID=UPI001425793D|nr:uncharacterized protein LOC117108241 [Anneissia japonica]
MAQIDISSPDGMNNLGSMIEQDWQMIHSYDIRSQVCAKLNIKFIDAESWDIDDVQKWIRWVSTACLNMEEWDVQPVRMDGRSLCSCTENDFREMLQVPPSVGVMFHQIFQAWYRDDVQTIKACEEGVYRNNMIYKEPVHYQQMEVYHPEIEHQENIHSQIVSDITVAPNGCQFTSPPAHYDRAQYDRAQARYDRAQARYDRVQAQYDRAQAPYDQAQTPPYDRAQAPYDRPQDFGRPLPMCPIYPMAATYPGSMGRCQMMPCDTDMVSNDLDTQPKKKRGPGRPKISRPPKTKKLQLFEFLLDYLEDPCSPHLEWIDKSSGLFRFQSAHKEDFANKWGDYKGNRNMTYQNLARALRNYCHSNTKIMVNEKKKLHYRFNIDAIMEHPTRFKIVFGSYVKHTRES